MMNVDQALAERFKCCKCNATGGLTKRFAATGTGLSKMFDIQHNQFIVVSCHTCGYTELYNPDILEGKKNLGTIMDLLFG